MKETILERLNLSEKEIDYIIGDKDLYSIPKEDLRNKIFIFTGKGTRNQVIHLGHQFLYKKLSTLSQEFETIIQVSSDEKRNLGEKIQNLDQCRRYEQIFLDYLKGLDFEASNTKLVLNTEQNTNFIFYSIANLLAKHLKLRTILNTHGNLNVYQAFYLCIQMVPILIKKYENPEKRAVIITADDQKGCFLLLRDIASKLNLKPPIIIILKGLKDLKMRKKMSSSSLKDCVPLSDITKIKKGISSEFLDEDFCNHLRETLTLKKEVKDYNVKKNDTLSFKKYLIEVITKELEEQEKKYNSKKDINFRTLSVIERYSTLEDDKISFLSEVQNTIFS